MVGLRGAINHERMIDNPKTTPNVVSTTVGVTMFPPVANLGFTLAHFARMSMNGVIANNKSAKFALSGHKRPTRRVGEPRLERNAHCQRCPVARPASELKASSKAQLVPTIKAANTRKDKAFRIIRFLLGAKSGVRIQPLCNPSDEGNNSNISMPYKLSRLDFSNE